MMNKILIINKKKVKDLINSKYMQKRIIIFKMIKNYSIVENIDLI